MADYANWLDIHTNATNDQLTGRNGVLDVIARAMAEELGIEKVSNNYYIILQNLLSIVIHGG